MFLRLYLTFVILSFAALARASNINPCVLILASTGHTTAFLDMELSESDQTTLTGLEDALNLRIIDLASALQNPADPKRGHVIPEAMSAIGRRRMFFGDRANLLYQQNYASIQGWASNDSERQFFLFSLREIFELSAAVGLVDYFREINLEHFTEPMMLDYRKRVSSLVLRNLDRHFQVLGHNDTSVENVTIDRNAYPSFVRRVNLDRTSRSEALEKLGFAGIDPGENENMELIVSPLHQMEFGASSPQIIRDSGDGAIRIVLPLDRFLTTELPVPSIVGPLRLDGVGNLGLQIRD
jgi:hypothetical protein